MSESPGADGTTVRMKRRLRDGATVDLGNGHAAES
jgi:hypothetical protein